jgi:hypothetical protein
MNKLAIIGHQCCGDLFSMNSIYNYYFNELSEGLIFARDMTIKNIPKYLHALNRYDRDIKIYLNPTPINWYIV